jgi:hypothetical protein
VTHVPPVRAGTGPQGSADPGRRRRTEIELCEEAVRFIPNSASCKDPAAVDQLLAPLAARIRDERLRAHLTAATATAGTPEGRRQLLLMRAEAVKAVLVGGGAPRPR